MKLNNPLLDYISFVVGKLESRYLDSCKVLAAMSWRNARRRNGFFLSLVAAGVLACRRAGASRPAEKTLQQPDALVLFVSH